MTAHMAIDILAKPACGSDSQATGVPPEETDDGVDPAGLGIVHAHPDQGHSHRGGQHGQEVDGAVECFESVADGLEQPSQRQGDSQVERQDGYRKDECIPQADAKQVCLNRGAPDHLDEMPQADEWVAAAQTKDRTAQAPGAVIEEHQDKGPGENENSQRFIQQQREGHACHEAHFGDRQPAPGFWLSSPFPGSDQVHAAPSPNEK
jgi:hypothetical protein